MHVGSLIPGKAGFLDTVHSSLFYVPGRISISQSKLYGTNKTLYETKRGSLRQITDPILVKFMCLTVS